MRLDRSLGDVQIFSDFRVVTSLEQQLNDLLFPGSYVAEILFHKHHTLPLRPDGACGRAVGSSAHWIRVCAYDFAFTRPNRVAALN